MALTINRLGMSLMRMDKEDSVRFLDEIDLTFSLDSRKSSQEHTTSIELAIKPIVFRTSYRDIDLIMTIVNKAIELYGRTAPPSKPGATAAESSKRKELLDSKFNFTTGQNVRSQSQLVGQAQALMSKEQACRGYSLYLFLILINLDVQLKGSFDGFRFVLIGDMHEQPMLHLRVKPFIVGAKDWSGDVRISGHSYLLRLTVIQLQAMTTLSTQINYWNLTNSHWEPCK